MSRPQLIVIVVALLLAVGMFMLPKVIINKDKAGILSPETAKADAGKTASTDEEDHTGHNHAPGEGHEEDVNEAAAHKAVSAETLKALADVRSRYNRETNAASKLKLAEELAKQYTAVSKFDSAGYYLETVAKAKPSEQNFVKAGDQYFEAFSFAATEARGKQLGEKTQAMYTKALEANPNNLSAKTNLAMTYIAGPNPMQGIGLLREVLEKDPNNEKAIYNMGYLSLQSRQFDKAADRFKKLVEVNPNHVNGNFYLGVSLAETGKKEEAKAAFNKAKALDKNPELQASIDEYLKKL